MHYLLHELHWSWDQVKVFPDLEESEKALIWASVQVSIEDEKEQADKIRNKGS